MKIITDVQFHKAPPVCLKMGIFKAYQEVFTPHYAGRCLYMIISPRHKTIPCQEIIVQFFVLCRGLTSVAPWHWHRDSGSSRMKRNCQGTAPALCSARAKASANWR